MSKTPNERKSITDFGSHELDELVDTVASEVATNINNGGWNEQIQYLVTMGGLSHDEIVERLR